MRFALQAFSTMLRATGSLDRRRARMARDHVLVLNYHGIGHADVEGAVTAGEFRRQLEFLRSRFRIIRLRDLLTRDLPPTEDGRPLAVVTLDDGLRNHYEVAFPVFRETQVPSTVFILPALVDRNEVIWTGLIDRLVRTAPSGTLRFRNTDVHLESRADRERAALRLKAALKRLDRAAFPSALESLKDALGYRPGEFDPGPEAPLTWSMAREMEDSGLIEFASHSQTHLLLTTLSDAELAEELSGSLAQLQANLKRPAPILCYPDGAYDSRVISFTKEAGYLAGVTTDHGWARRDGDRFRIPRVGVYRTTSWDLFLMKTSGF